MLLLHPRCKRHNYNENVNFSLITRSPCDSEMARAHVPLIIIIPQWYNHASLNSLHWQAAAASIDYSRGHSTPKYNSTEFQREKERGRETIFVKMTGLNRPDRDVIVFFIFSRFQKVQAIYNEIIRTKSFIGKFRAFKNLEIWKDPDIYLSSQLESQCC